MRSVFRLSDWSLRTRLVVLLIVGGRDPQVLALNRDAADRLTAPHRLEVVPGATHLFAEQHALETVALAARLWFTRPGPEPSAAQ